jgi:hypothetical protein
MEPNYTRICTLILDFENPIVALQETFSLVSNWYGNLIEGLRSDFQLSVTPAEALRKDNVLAVIGVNNQNIPMQDDSVM